MNLPNKLTLLRIFLVPVFLLCMYLDFRMHFLIGLLVFAVASVTDALDGKIARKYHLITTFGKFADPLADKILVLAALAALADVSHFPVNGVVITIIAAREFMVSGLRLVTAEQGVVVAAGIWGKLKTAFTMIAIAVMLLWLAIRETAGTNAAGWVQADAIMQTISGVLVWISVLLTVISGGIYLKGYWKYMNFT